GQGIQPCAASGTQGWPLTRLIGHHLFRVTGELMVDHDSTSLFYEIQPATQATGESALKIVDLHFEHQPDASGIGVSRPRVSWRVESALPAWRQAAYEIEAYDASGQLGHQSGRVASEQSVLVSWPFAALHSRERLTVRLRVWGVDGQASEWSKLSPI